MIDQQFDPVWEDQLFMPIPFDKYNYLKMKDLERCPYPIFRNDPNIIEWTRRDDFRMLLIALDCYADRLQNK